MALMLGSLYDALISGGIAKDKAQKAAEEVAGYETRLAAIEARLTLLTWMVGIVIAGIIALLLRSFT
jgi:hypothetical protein